MAEKVNSRATMARGGIVGFFGAATSAILGFVLTLLLTRLMGSEDAGIVMQATAVFSVVLALSKLGMDSTAIFLLPRLKIDTPELIRHHLLYMATLAGVLSGAVGAVLYIVAPYVWGANQGELVHAIRTVVFFLPAGALLLLSSAALRALGGMKEYVLTQNIALPLLRPLLVALAIGTVGSIVSVSFAWAFPFLVVFAVSVVMLMRRLRAFEQAPGLFPPKKQRLATLAFAAPRTLAAGLEQAILWLDILIVGTLAGNAAAGIYGGASRFIQAGMVVDTALRVVVSPRLSALVHRKKTSEIVALHTTTTMWLILFATPIYVLMAIFAPTMMMILGADFASGAPVLVLLSIGVSITFLAGNIHTLLIMSGHSMWAAVNKVVVLVLNVGGNLLLIPRMGTAGAAITWVLCMVVDAVLASVEVHRFIGVSLKPMVFVKPLTVVGLAVAAPALLVEAVFGQGYRAFVLATGVCIVLFAVAVWVGRKGLHLNDLRQRRSVGPSAT